MLKYGNFIHNDNKEVVIEINDKISSEKNAK